MNQFMDENFLLNSDLAAELYHKYAKQQPIFDYHCHLSPQEIAEDKKYDNVNDNSLGEYIEELSKAADIKISDFDSLKNALRNRIEHFAAQGCVSSDHCFSSVPFVPINDNEADKIFSKRLSGEMLCAKEALGYITRLMDFLACEYKRHNWVMQLHFGIVRNSNTKMFGRIGKDTGFDRILQCGYRKSHIVSV